MENAAERPQREHRTNLPGQWAVIVKLTNDSPLSKTEVGSRLEARMLAKSIRTRLQPTEMWLARRRF